MTAFVESCVETAAGSALAAERGSRKFPKVRKLLRALASKRRVLVTTHQHPDPDGLASALGMRALLSQKLPQTEFNLSVKGHVGGGINEAFVRYAKLNLTPWNEESLSQYDAIVLLDTQPTFAYSPLPQGVDALAVIDHHHAKGRRLHYPYTDIRSDVGATSSIVFSYFMETETPISRHLAATLLYGIETDLAGAAGTPTELDNIALSSLTLLADTRLLYQMRYVDLPQSYYVAYAQGLATAQWYEHALVSHLKTIDSPEKPAVLADFLLRFDAVDWALVTAVFQNRLILSLRTSNLRFSASDIMQKLVRGIGEGGGHRTKAGGFVALQNGSATELERIRAMLLRRYLRAVGLNTSKGLPLVPPA
ncbi:MAG: DHH family phosphoesterase [Tepidisphaeraceae bacterium]|jgi:nanoRNase/pAp phosphatase (c-di-AMP/oligoRNAs hydrolase)